MTRLYRSSIATIVCERSRCPNFAPLDAPDLPPHVDWLTQQRWIQLQREEYQAANDRAWKATLSAPQPRGWLRLVGAHVYRGDYGNDNDPEFCSAKCARLWLSHHQEVL
jgi:hypothetical protein